LDFNPRLLILGFQSKAFNPMLLILGFKAIFFSHPIHPNFCINPNNIHWQSCRDGQYFSLGFQSEALKPIYFTTFLQTFASIQTTSTGSPVGTADISALDFNPRLLILGFQSKAFNPCLSILAF
jgi:hypothetical protein